jgi:hypothetical protein
MFVFELPDEVVAAVLSSWVDIEFLARFDTALCATEARPLFLTMIRQGCFIADGLHTFNALSQRKHVQYFEWLMLRQVKVRNWVVYDDVAQLCSPWFVDSFAGLHVRLLQLYTGCLNENNVVRSVMNLLRATPNVTDVRLISLYECPINDESLQILSDRAAQLEILKLYIQRQTFTPATVVALAERCTNLKTLSLMCGVGVDGAALEAFARNSTRLEGLQLSGPFSSASLTTVTMHCRSRLRYLTLNMKYSDSNGLNIISEQCRMLEELQLRNFGFRGGGLLVRLVSSLFRLRELVLMDCCVITDEVLIAIATHLPNLAALGLSGCEGYTEAGAQALTSLTQLQRFCFCASDNSVIAFTLTLLKRWQEASPGLKFYNDYHATTRHFEPMRWF